MTRNGQPIQEMVLGEVVRTGIEYERLLPELVPSFEEREAALHSNYTPTAWRELDPWERAVCVAHFRLHILVSLHQSDAVHTEVRRRQKPRQGR